MFLLTHFFDTTILDLNPRLLDHYTPLLFHNKQAKLS